MASAGLSTFQRHWQFALFRLIFRSSCRIHVIFLWLFIERLRIFLIDRFTLFVQNIFLFILSISKRKQAEYMKYLACFLFYLLRITYGSRYSKLGQVKFMEDSLSKIWSDMIFLGRPYYFNFFKVVFQTFNLVYPWIPWPIWVFHLEWSWYFAQRRVQDPVKQLRQSVLQKYSALT